MATLYWGGGNGTWSSSSATNWYTDVARLTPAAAAPTSADDVDFGAYASSYTVTIGTTPVCRNITWNGPGGANTVKFDGTGALTIYGSMTAASSGITAATTAFSVTFRATSSVTITPPAVLLTTGTTTFDGVGGVFTLGGALTAGGITVTNGTFDTGSPGYSITASNIQSNNSNTRTINLNASTITLSQASASAVLLPTATGLTFNAGTSAITISANSGGINCTGNTVTFYNVTVNSVTTQSIFGTLTFNNLTVAAKTTSGISITTFSGDLTVNGTLTITGSSGARRNMYCSNIIGTQRTITLGASATLAALTDVDFRDIKFLQTGNPSFAASGTRIGDCGGNTNVTATGAKTVYWNAAGSVNWGVSGGGGWATTNTGAPAEANFPLPQDTATFTEAGSAGTITVNGAWNIGTIQMADGVSNRTTAFTLATSTNTPAIYGSVTFFSSLTLSGTGAITFAGRGTQTITPAGISFTQPWIIDNVTGTVSLAANTTLGAGLTTTLTSGTLNVSTRTFTTGLFSSSGTATRALTFGSGGSITLSGVSTAGNITIWGVATATGFSYTGTPNITLSGASTANTRTIQHGSTAGGTESNAVSFLINAGSDTIATTVTSYIKNLDFSGGTFTGTLTNTTRNIHGNFTLKTGMTLTAGTNATTFAATSGTQTFTSAQSLDFPITVDAPGATVTLADNLTIGSTRAFTLTAGTWNVNAKTASVGSFASAGSVARAITFGTSGKITISGAGATAWSASGSNLTTTGTTATISMASASAKTFAGGGFNYAATLSQDGAGALTISGNNTFVNITNTTQPVTITFTAGSTQTVSSFTASGTSGNLVTLNSSSPGTRFTLSDASGTNTVSYCSITDSLATGGAEWSALLTDGNVNGGNNSGWMFSLPVAYSYSTDIKLRSLAQRGRF